MQHQIYHLKDFAEKYDHFYSLLSLDEKARAENFLYNKDRERFILSRGLLRESLSEHMNVAASKIEFSYQNNAKPYIKDFPLHFNMSHSKDYMLLAYSREGQIGVDIEYHKPRDQLRIAKRFFSELEYEDIISQKKENQAARFYKYWVIKEAVIKALGVSIACSLNQIQVKFTQDGVVIDFKDRCWKTFLFECPKNYSGAIVVGQKKMA